MSEVVCLQSDTSLDIFLYDPLQMWSPAMRILRGYTHLHYREPVSSSVIRDRIAMIGTELWRKYFHDRVPISLDEVFEKYEFNPEITEAICQFLMEGEA